LKPTLTCGAEPLTPRRVAWLVRVQNHQQSWQKNCRRLALSSLASPDLRLAAQDGRQISTVKEGELLSQRPAGHKLTTTVDRSCEQQPATLERCEKNSCCTDFNTNLISDLRFYYDGGLPRPERFRDKDPLRSLG
jgi:hypothetical protein